MGDVGLEIRGRWYDLKLAEDQNGRPMFATSIPRISQSSVQVGEATYAARIPEIQGVFVQPDLSGGVGQRNQVPSQKESVATRYHYADGADASNGIGPGPETVTIDKLTDGGPISGAFELGGNLHLVCGRKIALYDTAGTISEVEDLGVGVVGYGGATFVREGAEASDQTSTGTGATDTIAGPQAIIAEKITPAASKDLGRVDLQLLRTDVIAVQTVTITGVPTGGTFTVTYAGATTSDLAYNVSAADMQTALRLLAGLGAVTVTLGNWVYTVTFTGVVGLAVPLVVGTNALTGGTLPALTVAQTRLGSAVTGNVELAVQADYNGRPSGYDLAVATADARSLPTTAGTVAFRFDDGDRYFQESGVPFWIVLRAIGATTSATVGWTRTTSGDQNGATSADMGNSWAAAYKHYHTTYSKAITATAFVGKAAGSKFLTTTDGTTYSADTSYEAKHFVKFPGMLVRDCRSSSAGAISWSYDGLNWSEALVIDDATIQVTALLRLGSALIVVKEDSIWAVDPSADTVKPEQIYAGGKSTANGPGACVWHGAAFIPFDGKLMGITGDLTNGFDVKQSIGPDAGEEWDAPFGAGRVVAVVGDRHCLYAAMSTTGSYKLFKSYAPLEAKWHGSIADLGTASAFNMMYLFDQGGTENPLLFYSTTSDNIGKIICPRTPNPWGDASYRVSTSTGKLYHPWANGNAHVNLKAWLRVSQTFAQEAASGYVDEMWDSLDGNGWRALDGGRLYRTGAVPFPVGLQSRLLKRQTRITAGSATAYPVLAASGLSYAVRPEEGLRQFAFSLDAKDGLSAHALGDMLGVTGLEVSAAAFLAATGSGTVRLRDPDKRIWSVLILNATDTMVTRRDGAKAAVVEVVGVTQ